MPGIPPILGAGVGPQHEELIRQAAKKESQEDEARRFGLEEDIPAQMREQLRGVDFTKPGWKLPPPHKIFSPPRPGPDGTTPWNLPWENNIPPQFLPDNPFRRPGPWGAG